MCGLVKKLRNKSQVSQLLRLVVYNGSPLAKTTKIVSRSLYVIAVLGGFALIVELVARYALGLGTPPLSVSHPTIEYLFKPDQDIKRFGNRFQTNSFGMRSEEFAVQPADRERRVLIFGDSVVVGGSQMDQASIATELLKERLRAASPGNLVTVGNVSAGSWGPGNWRAWLGEYGHLGASQVILVVSSHDLEDNPTFAPLNPLTHPETNPSSATHELLTRYFNINSFLNKLKSYGLFRESSQDQIITNRSASHRKAPSKELSASVKRGLDDLQGLVQGLRDKGVKVGVVQFWERGETASGNPRPEHSALFRLFRDMGVPAIQSIDFFWQCSSSPSVDLYVDSIHPYTEAGQECLADAIEAVLKKLG